MDLNIDFWDIFTSIIGMIFKIGAFLLSPFIAVFIVMSILIVIIMLYEMIFNKKRLPKSGKFKKRNPFMAIFYDFPRQFVTDRFNKEDFEFNEYGLHMICGEQGSGKSSFMIWMLNKWKILYPESKCATNMGYKYEDDVLGDWQELIGRNNGKKGQIEVIDEIQTWFNSNASGNFPPEMLGEISQQRKQRKCIVGTAQVFSRIAKPLREQTHFIYMPMTFCGCLTVVRSTKRKYWNNDKQKFTKYTGFMFFVHNPFLRESFDTYKKIEKYVEEGFKPVSEQMRSHEEKIALLDFDS